MATNQYEFGHWIYFQTCVPHMPVHRSFEAYRPFPYTIKPETKDCFPTPLSLKSWNVYTDRLAITYYKVM